MSRDLTRGEFLAEGGKICLGLAASGVLTAGCARMAGVNADATKPAGAPESFLAMEADVKPAYYFIKGRLKGILVRLDTGIVGYENVCPHWGGPTKFEDGRLRCLWHGARFEAATGKVIRGPAKSGLRPLKLAVQGGMVLLLTSA